MSAMEQAAAVVVVAILLIIGVEALYKRGTNIEYMTASLFLRRGHPHRNLIVSAVKSPKSRAPLAEKPHNKAPLGKKTFPYIRTFSHGWRTFGGRGPLRPAALASHARYRLGCEAGAGRSAESRA